MHIIILVERSWTVIVIHCSDSQRRQPDRNGDQAHTHPQSVTLILLATRAHRSFLHLQTESLPTSHPGLHDAPWLPAYDSTNPQANTGSQCPVSHRTVNTISLATDIDHDRPYGIFVLRTHSSSSPRALIFYRPAYSRSCALFSESSHGPCRRRAGAGKGLL